MHKNKGKLNKDTNDDNFRPMQNPETPEKHNYMTSHFDVIKKHDQRKCNKGNIYILQTESGNQ